MVEIKGWRNGLLVQFSADSSWDVLRSALETKLAEANIRTFWKNAQTTLVLGNRLVSGEDLSSLVDFLKQEYGIIPIAVVTTQSETKLAAEKLFLTVYDVLPTVQKAQDASVANAKTTERAASPLAGGELENNAHYISGTIRSGQRLVHTGNLVICGDVNPGAEVLAGGDIVVMGNLRGMAHAGCYGNLQARIVARMLRSPQLRIADQIARSPEDQGDKMVAPPRPEVAQIKNGKIEVSPL